LISLKDALRLAPDACLALVGAGGKTRALFQLAGELPPPVFVTATTHLAEEQLALADEWRQVEDPEQVEAAARQMQGQVRLFIGSPDGAGRRLGLASPALERLRAVAGRQGIPLLIEADGARQLPLKAPGEHEPALPFIETPPSSSPALDGVIVVAGLSGLGKPLDSNWVHRYERFAELAGLPIGAPISAQAVRRVLLHPEGGLKNIPPGARRFALLNQADTPELQSQAYNVIGEPASGTRLLGEYHAVVVAALHAKKVWAVHEPVAGVVLAAGSASRFGRAKQVIEWQGETLVHRAARTALEAGLSPVIVVTGAYVGETQAALTELKVTLAHNSDWEAGQSASVQTGVRALPEGAGAAVFLLVDQPLVSASLIRRLVEVHAESLPPVVAPQAGGRRANPVLFDRSTFAHLLDLDGDQGGRQLFTKFAPTWVPWHDEAILGEIDTPEDYQRLLDLYSP